MVFCKRKSEKKEAFRVGRHQLPEWVLEQLKRKNSGVHITVKVGFLETNIIIEKENFKAESGDWIVNDDGVWIKYSNAEFRKIFEVLCDEN